MPFLIPSEDRINFLIETFSEGGFDAAMITEKSNFFYYITELEEIGPCYLMDDFGNGIAIEDAMFWQRGFIYPPLAELT
jgi:hypothetical protein